MTRDEASIRAHRLLKAMGYYEELSLQTCGVMQVAIEEALIQAHNDAIDHAANILETSADWVWEGVNSGDMSVRECQLEAHWLRSNSREIKKLRVPKLMPEMTTLPKEKE